MSDIQTAIAKVITIVKGVEGIRYAPEYPPENIKDFFPFVTAYTVGGEWTAISSSFKQVLFDIMLEVHIGRKGDLPHEVERAMSYADSIPEALIADQTLDDTVSHFEKIDYAFGALNYGETETIGFKFILRGVKIH
jgi:hypothetical protein